MTGKMPDGGRRARRQDIPTMAAIARLAGVSKPTVSRVLNGRSGVAAQTRQQVEALLREHGYRRPTGALPAASVEVVFFGLESHSAVSIMRGVESVARRHDLVVGFTDISMRTAGERPWAEQLLGRRPVGVIAAHSYFTTEGHDLLTASGIPMVALDPAGLPPASVPSVGAANWTGGVATARHVLELGHRRIAVIAGPAGSLAARARLDGSRAAMDAAGVPLDERLVRTGEFFFEEGLALGQDLLGAESPPTAIICGNDLQALGVYEAARRARLVVPDDLSVVGFDDLDSIRYYGPPLTTVRQPFDEMGIAAARLVMAYAAGEVPSHTRVELPATLIVRGSTAPPAAAAEER